MTRFPIGTTLEQSSYSALARLHRPSDQQQLSAEIRRLAATGLKPRDIAITMRLDVHAVLEALNATTPRNEDSR